jgi:hypothetical protein
VVYQSVERYRPRKSVLEIQAQPKSFENAQRIRPCRKLVERADDPGAPAALALFGRFVVAGLPNILPCESASFLSNTHIDT